MKRLAQGRVVVRRDSTVSKPGRGEKPPQCRLGHDDPASGSPLRAVRHFGAQNGSVAGTSVTGTSVTSVRSHRANSSIPACSDGMCPMVISATHVGEFEVERRFVPRGPPSPT